MLTPSLCILWSARRLLSLDQAPSQTQFSSAEAPFSADNRVAGDISGLAGQNKKKRRSGKPDTLPLEPGDTSSVVPVKFVQVMNADALLAEAACDAVEVQLQGALMGFAKPRLVDGRVVRYFTARNNATPDFCGMQKRKPVSGKSLGMEKNRTHSFLKTHPIDSRDMRQSAERGVRQDNWTSTRATVLRPAQAGLPGRAFSASGRTFQKTAHGEKQKGDDGNPTRADNRELRISKELEDRE